jgi:hypothetical protein
VDGINSTTLLTWHVRNDALAAVEQLIGAPDVSDATVASA